MENNNNIFRGRGDNKQPSRLRKQAPATLQLDPTTSGSENVGGSSANNNTFSNCPIPLLSPLVLTPPPLPKIDDPQEAVVGVEGGSHDEPRKGSDDQNGSESTTAPSSSSSSSDIRWQHPAAPASAFIEPSSIISFFQTQCVLVHHIQ